MDKLGKLVCTVAKKFFYGCNEATSSAEMKTDLQFTSPRITVQEKCSLAVQVKERKVERKGGKNY